MKTSKLSFCFFVFITLLFLIASKTTLFAVVVKNNNSAKTTTAKKTSIISKLKQKFKRKVDRFKKKVDRFKDGDKKMGATSLILIGVVLLLMALLFLNAFFSPSISCAASLFYFAMSIVLGVSGLVTLCRGLAKL